MANRLRTGMMRCVSSAATAAASNGNGVREKGALIQSQSIARSALSSMRVLGEKRQRFRLRKSLDTTAAPTKGMVETRFSDNYSNKTPARIPDKELDTRVSDFMGSLRQIRKRLMLLDQEIENMQAQDPTIKYQSSKKLQPLLDRRNELTQYKLKQVGRGLGDLIMQVGTSPYCSPADARLVFDLYCKDFEPNPFHFNALIESYARAHRVDLAIDVFHEMSDRGVTPDKWTFIKIAQGYARLPELRAKECNMWLGRMVAAGHRPDHKALDIALHVSARAKDVPACSRLLREMLAKEFVPKRDTLRRVLTAFLSTDSLEEWSELQKELLEKSGLEIDPDIASEILGMFCKKGLFDSCGPLLDVMRRRGALQRLDKDVVKSIGKMYKMRGMHEEAKMLLALSFRTLESGSGRKEGTRRERK